MRHQSPREQLWPQSLQTCCKKPVMTFGCRSSRYGAGFGHSAAMPDAEEEVPASTPDAAALAFFALFSHAHRLCCSFVFCAWHRRHKVRMLSTVHSPPPSFTARIWSASHADPSYASLANLSVCARVNCGAKLSIIGKRWCGFKHLMRETNAWQSSLHFSHTPRSRSKPAMRNVFPDLDCTWYSKQSFEQKRSCKESGCCSCC